MTHPALEAADLVGVGAEAIQKRATDLGLMWQLRPATVSSAGSDTASPKIVFDGDSVALTATNLTGDALEPGSRLMGMILPGGANYVIGYLGPSLQSTVGYCSTTGFATAGTTTSGVFVDLPGPKTATMVKKLSSTALMFSMTATSYTNIVATEVIFGINIAGPVTSLDLNMAVLFHNSVLVHAQAAGVNSLPGVEAGTLTFTARWARLVGTGTLTQDANDWVSFSVMEIPGG